MTIFDFIAMNEITIAYHLIIKNLVQVTARIVKATLDGKPIMEHPAVLSDKENEKATTFL